MARGKALKNPNGYGSVVKLSGNRRYPFEIRVNTKLDERNHPIYDVLARFRDQKDAIIILAEYNKQKNRLQGVRGLGNFDDWEQASKDLNNHMTYLGEEINILKITFQELYVKFYRYKYELSGRKYSDSTKHCTAAAYKNSSALHDKIYKDLRADEFRTILNQTRNGKALTHSSQEHIKNLFGQMDRFALENDIIQKGYSQFAKIVVDDDDVHGVPFTPAEIEKLWGCINVPFVDTILILIYSGWRINELGKMPLSDIDIENWTFRGGLKTKSSKNRIVPIHSKIQSLVEKRYNPALESLIYHNFSQSFSEHKFRQHFNGALDCCGIEQHTPHDCRHTFASLLDSAGANKICIDRLLGHASKDITDSIYTHKTIEELRENIELI